MKNRLIFELLTACEMLFASASNRVVKQPELRWCILRLVAMSDESILHVTNSLTSNQHYCCPGWSNDIATYLPSGELIIDSITDNAKTIICVNASEG